MTVRQRAAQPPALSYPKEGTYETVFRLSADHGSAWRRCILAAVSAGGAGGYGGFDFNGADFGDIFGDIFGDLFGGGRRGGRANNGPMKGANIRKGVRITFEEAIFGCEKELDIVLKDPCTKCNGTGAKPGTSPETCSKCGGK